MAIHNATGGTEGAPSTSLTIPLTQTTTPAGYVADPDRPGVSYPRHSLPGLKVLLADAERERDAAEAELAAARAENERLRAGIRVIRAEAQAAGLRGLDDQLRALLDGVSS